MRKQFDGWWVFVLYILANILIAWFLRDATSLIDIIGFYAFTGNAIFNIISFIIWLFYENEHKEYETFD